MKCSHCLQETTSVLRAEGNGTVLPTSCPLQAWRVAESPLFCLFLKGPPAEWPLMPLSFVPGEIRNKSLLAQEAPRQRGRGEWEGPERHGGRAGPLLPPDLRSPRLGAGVPFPPRLSHSFLENECGLNLRDRRTLCSTLMLMACFVLVFPCFSERN